MPLFLILYLSLETFPLNSRSSSPQSMLRPRPSRRTVPHLTISRCIALLIHVESELRLHIVDFLTPPRLRNLCFPSPWINATLNIIPPDNRLELLGSYRQPPSHQETLRLGIPRLPVVNRAICTSCKFFFDCIFTRFAGNDLVHSSEAVGTCSSWPCESRCHIRSRLRTRLWIG